ncbi:hypothetical protein BC938DRAFT_482616 [Jimgerdemannia flammicorona]|uniref:Uncharacterized protein n=1 Tax=Jimgerdemannia flammicorona TaxID=994334 RepID=A0A433QDI6_9FUNG|nr:hypothetical protein BC938DRAFT_482616 [Jimgerdemannia flammicorona]
MTNLKRNALNGTAIEEIRLRFFNEFDQQWLYVQRLVKDERQDARQRRPKHDLGVSPYEAAQVQHAEGIPAENTRKRKIREAGQCLAMIRTTIFPATKMVRVERLKSDTSDHSKGVTASRSPNSSATCRRRGHQNYQPSPHPRKKFGENVGLQYLSR